MKYYPVGKREVRLKPNTTINMAALVSPSSSHLSNCFKILSRAGKGLMQSGAEFCYRYTSSKTEHDSHVGYETTHRLALIYRQQLPSSSSAVMFPVKRGISVPII